MIYLLQLELHPIGIFRRLDDLLKSVSNNAHVGCLHLSVFWDGRESLGIAPRDKINGSNSTSDMWPPQTLAVRSQDLKFQETLLVSGPTLLILHVEKLKLSSLEPVLMVINALFRLISNTFLMVEDNVFFGVQDERVLHYITLFSE